MKDMEYLQDMPKFKEVMETDRIVRLHDERLPGVIREWTQFLIKQRQKGFVNLFLTGSGVSAGVVSDLLQIIKKLYDIYSKKFEENKIDKDKDVEDLFYSLLQDKKEDRSIVARLLNVFQEKEKLRDHVWQEMNEWLFNEIYDANPTPFHENLVKLAEVLDVLCLTLNFDGLLIKAMLKDDKNKPFSLPTCTECENYFLREKGAPDGKKEFLEIQIRGDILYVFCNSKSFCPQKDKKVPLSAFHGSYTGDDEKGENNENEENKKRLLKCPSCGEQRYSLLSFPGSNEKENDMQDMLKIIWKYCAFRVGSVTAVGISGKWDPSIVAFLGDLLNEREIPLLVVDKPEGQNSGNKADPDSYLIKELIMPKLHNSICLNVGADSFMEETAKTIDSNIKSMQKVTNEEGVTEDNYWHKLKDDLKNNESKPGWPKKIYDDICNSLELQYSSLENAINKAIQKESLENFKQLGLKSHWLGITGDNDHNRYNHSIGVMKISTLLYDGALKNSGIMVNEEERQFLRLAALLHDVGHLPFSHLIESVFQELNWKPAGYSDNYSHALQTEEKIEGIFSKPELASELKKTGYYIKDLISLAHGRFGVPYLDAIINSPLDADKIDYVFRDTDSTGRKISLSNFQFLFDVYEGISLSPEKFITLSKTSSKAFAELLHARRFLYHNLYLQSSILILEGIVKLILKTYFVHNLKLDDSKIIEKLRSEEKDIPDLGEYKIKYCVKELLNIMKQKEGENNIELAIVEFMVDKITEIQNQLSSNFFTNLKKGWAVVKNYKSQDQMKDLEQKRSVREFNTAVTFDSVLEISKDVAFRIPGAAIIELRKLHNYLSIADSRKEIERSDGTNACAECILVPDGHYIFWNSASKATKALQDSSLKDYPKNTLCVYLYPLSGESDDTYFKQAVNLFDKLAKKKGISSKI